MRIHETYTRAVRVGGSLAAIAAALVACGGGGGGTSSTAGATSPVGAATDPAVSVLEMATKQVQQLKIPSPKAAVAVAPNLLSNPGFEQGMTDWFDWSNSQVADGDATSGSHSLHVGTAAGGTVQLLSGIVPGTQYRLTSQAKVSDPSEVVYMGVIILDGNESRVFEQLVPVSSTSYSPATIDIPAPAGAVKTAVFFWKNAGNGIASVDDVSLIPADTAVASTAPAPASDPTAAAPAAAPAPAPAPSSAPSAGPVDVGVIPVASWPNTFLQTGFANDAYWVGDNVWAPWGLTRGGYGGEGGTTYEQNTGVSPQIGPNGEVAFRYNWKWPNCCTEIKSFPSVISGRKPGYFNTWTLPGGNNVRLLDGSDADTHPSGATPGTFFPLQLPIASLKTSFNYRHLSTPSGRGHLAYDMFLQSTPTQSNGFGNTITHEIIIPLDYWGGYGAHPTGRNPAWYDHDVTIDGLLFHVYAAKDWDGGLRPDWGAGWKFIVFEPDRPIAPGTLDLAKFINYITTRRDVLGTPWANGNEFAVSVELGVEPQVGEGDIQVTNYRVWR